ncbi:MAG: 16S rRNA (adenine(1518)-N(6)/adenine(1519)-N(6))-dimethyltransferase RsmA [Chloroflexota bacterium]
MLVRRTKGELRRLDIRARKGLGQHFLVDRAVLNRIVTAAELTATDVVLEVGPGLGILTEKLADIAASVVAIEIDPRLASALEERLASCGNVTVVNRDVLQTEPGALLGLAADKLDTPYKVVANLPYYIASAVVRSFLEGRPKPCVMVVTVQKEVAAQMVAEPGGMSLLSVGVQFYGKPSIVQRIPASKFYPRPKVDSAVVRIDVFERPAVDVDDEAEFFNVVRAGFSAPRKQLHNALAQGLLLSPHEAASLVERAGVCKKRRAETLSLEEWARIYRACRDR